MNQTLRSAILLGLSVCSLLAGCEQKPKHVAADDAAPLADDHAPDASVKVPASPAPDGTAATGVGTNSPPKPSPAPAAPAPARADAGPPAMGTPAMGTPSTTDASKTALGEYMTEIATMRRALQVPDGAGMAAPAIAALGGAPHAGDIAALTALKGAYENASKTLIAQHAPDAVQPHRLLLIETLTLATSALGKRIVAASTGDKFDPQRKRAETKLNAMHAKLEQAEQKLDDAARP